MRIFDRIMVVLYLAVATLPFAAMKLKWHDHEIFGSLPPAPYPEQLSRDSVLSEEFQKGFTAWFESNRGFKGLSIAVDNTLLYHLFHDTRWGSQVMLGKDGILLKDEDIAYYNKTDLPDQARVDALADKIAQLQTRLAAEHRGFVPLIIPSKTTIYRDAVPAMWTRDLGDPRPSDDRVYRAMVAALDARKVKYVDARALFMSGTYPRDLIWSVEARHWSDYGACISMQAVVRLYSELAGKPPLPYDCQVERKRKSKTYVDFDLWQLLNAWGVPREPAMVPIVTHREPPPAPERPSVMFIGTSFMWQPLRDADASHVFGAEHMDYYNKVLVEWPKDIHTAVKPHTKEWRDVFLVKDLYVLDLLEVYLLAPDTYVDEVLAELGSELDATDDHADPTTGAAITSINDLGVTDGAHYFELWGTFPPGAPFTAALTCDGVRTVAKVYYQNPNGQQLNVSVPDPGPGVCEQGRASGVHCTFRVKQSATIGSPAFGPRRVCPAPQGQNGQDADGRCTATTGC